MAVRYAPKKLRVPHGFQDILESLAREVLREQPHDIVKFAALHFKHQIDLRNGSSDNMGKIFSKQTTYEVEDHNDKEFEDISEIPETTRHDQLSSPGNKNSNTSVSNHHAATKIQAGYRGHRARKEVQQLRESRSQMKTSTEDHDTSTYMNEETAATKIQAGFRGHQTRKAIKEGQSQTQISDDSISPDVQPRYGERENGAAIRIQSGFRGYKTRRDLKENQREKDHQALHETENRKSDDKFEYDDQRIQAATKIQAGYRGYITRNEMKKQSNTSSDVIDSSLDETFHQRELEKDRAAAKIQAGYRGYTTRRDLQNQQKRPTQQEELHKDDMTEDAAAAKIQAGFRGYKTRKQVRTKGQDVSQMLDQNDTPEDLQEMNSAASKIQAQFRGHKTRKDLQAQRDTEQYENERSLAASKIQAGFRGSKTRKQLKEKSAAGEFHTDQQTEEPQDADTHIIDDNQNNLDVAATKIQAHYKGYRTRKQLHQRKDDTDQQNDEPIAPSAQENLAATKIQAGFRGHQARQKVNSMRDHHET